ncbi:MAG: M23 family metallopeptidase [Alphaproteobacteria bacterium]|nr:M23 family metallopeptidase [Alphaproteobacteria bacterium]
MRLLLLLALLLAALPADALDLKGRSTQGGFLVGKTDPGNVVMLDGDSVPVGPAGNFVIGFGRDYKRVAEITVRSPNGTEQTLREPITPRTYDIQEITGVPQKYVTPPEEALARIAQDIQQVKVARSKMTPVAWFEGGFGWPVYGTITGVYGSQRVFNGEPRRPHFGIDIAAPEGTPVTAAADGIVTLAHEDMYYSGGTVIIDHGYGLNTTYLHLSRLAVSEGDIVRQGDPIGAVGATGRSTGPHLDVRLNWFQERLDFRLAAGEMFQRPQPLQ